MDLTQLLKGTTPQLLLAALSRREMYGYELIKDVREKSDDVISLGEGSVYPILHALEKEGLVKSHWVHLEKGPGRKYYRITVKGKRTLEDAKKQWKGFELAVERVLFGY